MSKNKTFAVSLDLTVYAVDEKEATAYADAIASHINDAIRECGDCANAYAHCVAECGNISQVDELFENEDGELTDIDPNEN